MVFCNKNLFPLSNFLFHQNNLCKTQNSQKYKEIKNLVVVFLSKLFFQMQNMQPLVIFLWETYTFLVLMPMAHHNITSYAVMQRECMRIDKKWIVSELPFNCYACTIFWIFSTVFPQISSRSSGVSLATSASFLEIWLMIVVSLFCFSNFSFSIDEF